VGSANWGDSMADVARQAGFAASVADATLSAAQRQKLFAMADSPSSEGRDWERIEFVGAEVALDALASGGGLLVDVRGQRAFDQGHFPGAICRSKGDGRGSARSHATRRSISIAPERTMERRRVRRKR